jgi:hypothetical protein
MFLNDGEMLVGLFPDMGVNNHGPVVGCEKRIRLVSVSEQCLDNTIQLPWGR